LALALGKRPDLLLLDEPVANLDPLARREFLAALMEEVADTGLTVVLSSHLMADLDRVCDYIVLLSASRLQLAGPTEDLLASHRLLIGPRVLAEAITGSHAVVAADYTDRQASLIVRADGQTHDPAWTTHELSLEDLVLAYMRAPDTAHLPRPKLATTAQAQR
jgi:ABC-2 type transport system ATP-binding protein